MLKRILSANNNWTGLVLRLTLGLILFPHGAQKLLGWFGGNGFSGTMNYLTEMAGLPWIIAFLVIIIEFFGSLSLVIGFASRLWAFAIFIQFIGIIFTAHWEYGFFMNWQGDKQGEGFEYHLLVIGIALAIVLNGSGIFSIDKALENEPHDYR